ncbi:MAG: N-acetyltransferase [Actinobacteria bacterium]|nr:N-acetyltransferase [Actinomycetota bacterium]
MNAENNYYVHESSYVDDGVQIGEGTKVWHFSHIQSGAKIGKDCSFGQNVNVGNNVIIGDNCRIQNNVSLYEGVILDDGVFCGPSCVFTNDFTPRARFSRGKESWLTTHIEHDASIGANATIVCGNTIGAYALIGSGAVVTHDVLPHALMAGVPARRIGWVCKCGMKLDAAKMCPSCGMMYEEEDGHLVCREVRD